MLEKAEHVQFQQQTMSKANNGRPVLQASRPWEDSTVGLLGVSVTYDGHLFKMWYRCSWFLWGFAQSTDGIKWQKPLLGLIDLDRHLLRGDGSGYMDHNKSLHWDLDGKQGQSYWWEPRFRGTRNNLISIDGGLKRTAALTVTLDQSEPLEWQYKMLYECHSAQVCLATSADGYSFVSRNGGAEIIGRASDTYNTLYWDPQHRRYLLNSRREFSTSNGWRDVRGHRVMSSSTLQHNLSNWTLLNEWYLDAFSKKEIDVHHLYSLSPSLYQRIHFGVAAVLLWPRDLRDGPVDTLRKHNRDVLESRLVTSRDGVHWDLRGIYSNVELIKRGRDGSWDQDIVAPATSLVTTGGRHLLFYYGANERHHHVRVQSAFTNRSAFDKSASIPNHLRQALNKVQVQVGLASCVEGRLVGAVPSGGAVASLRTRAFLLAGTSLWVNAKVSSTGWLVAKVITADGNVTTLESEKVTNQDNVNIPIRWPQCTVGNATSSPLARYVGTIVKIDFAFTKAILFSFKFRHT